MNNRGSYECSCDGGFVEDTSVAHPDHGITCVDDNECEGGLDWSNNCDPKADCINTPGSFSCKCRPGFESPDMMGYYCEDIDECSGIGI